MLFSRAAKVADLSTTKHKQDCEGLVGHKFTNLRYYIPPDANVKL